jgi:hypothetical protein
VATKDLGRGIRIQAQQVGFGISAVKPLRSNQPKLTSGSVWFSCLENLLSRIENIWPVLLARLIQKPIDLQPPGRSIA